MPMKSPCRFLIVPILCFLAPIRANADEPGRSARPTEEQVRRVQRILDEPLIDRSALPEETTLGQLLESLEKQLPRGKKLALRLDEKALGKDAEQLRGSAVRVRFGSPRRSLGSILAKTIGQLKPEVEYGIRADAVVITQPRLASVKLTYDVGDIVKEMPLLLPDIGRLFEADPTSLFRAVDPHDGTAVLARLLLGSISLREWEDIDILNGGRLVVQATPRRQAEVFDLLAALRRLMDLAVVMNARLYEVDRAFFRREVEPLFARGKGSPAPVPVRRIQKRLLQKILKEKLILESDEVRIRPRDKVTFLCKHSVFRSGAGAPKGDKEKGQPGLATSGVTFEVRPLVSLDRRYLRLEISQRVTQWLDVEQKSVENPLTGKEKDAAAGRLRKTTVNVTVQIADGDAILMAVDYQPPGKGSEGKVWLVVARPFIWIKAEADELHREGQELSGKSIWASELPKEEEDAPPKTRLPLEEDTKQILQSIVKDALTNPELESTRAFYGTPEDRAFSLGDSDKLGWPKGFEPEVKGYKRVSVRRDPFKDGRRVLGIRLDKFNLKEKATDPRSSPIEVCLYNAGGSANGEVIGSCTAYYSVRRVGKRWTVSLDAIIDP
jgi:hypothetical protein